MPHTQSLFRPQDVDRKRYAVCDHSDFVVRGYSAHRSGRLHTPSAENQTLGMWSVGLAKAVESAKEDLTVIWKEGGGKFVTPL